MSLKISIKNYKSIRAAEMILRPGITILVGPNGSGKTCILSALQFLRDVFRGGAAQALARQGGSRRVYHHGRTEMTFAFSKSYGERTFKRRKVPCEFNWDMTISQAGADHIATIVKENVQITCIHKNTRIVLFSIEADRTGINPKIRTHLCPPNQFGHDLFSVWKSEHQSKRFISEQFSERGTVKTFERLKKYTDQSCFPIVAQLDGVLNEIYSSFMFLNEYNILPDLARASSEQLPFAKMAPNGEGVGEVVDALENKRYRKLEQLRYMEYDDVWTADQFYLPYHLFRSSFTQHYRARRWKSGREPYSEALENINQQLAAAVRPITEVSVDIDPTNGRRFVVFRAGAEKFYPEEVSDGTVKWLCILVSLFVPFSRVYIIEEPENFLHPWMQQRLIEIMRQQAKQNDTIFLLSSHSATILNAALPDELLIVKHTSEGTTMKAMSNLDDIRKVLSDSDFHLGDLWVSGAIGGVPADE